MLKIVNDAIQLMQRFQINGTPMIFIQHDSKIEFRFPGLDKLVLPFRFMNIEKPCNLWMSFTYRLLARNLLQKKDWFIPQGCQECYKVVVRPRTYRELLDLEAMMLEIETNCKCGIEERPYTRGIYGAYFYNTGLQEGIERYEKIRDAVDVYISPDVQVFLKRGCTEYERDHGPSDKWVVTDLQVEIENDIAENVTMPIHPNDSEERIEQIHDKWRRFAWKYDPKFDGEPVYPDYVKYRGK